MTKGIMDDRDWDKSPEQRNREAQGLNAQGVIVNIGKYLGVTLETINTDPKPLMEGLTRWASQHTDVVHHAGDSATFYSQAYQFRIQIRMTRQKPVVCEYVGTVIDRRTGKALHITDGHTKIPNVLSEFKSFIEFAGRIKG